VALEIAIGFSSGAAAVETAILGAVSGGGRP
jgi:hypothetical protein